MLLALRSETNPEPRKAELKGVSLKYLKSVSGLAVGLQGIAAKFHTVVPKP